MASILDREQQTIATAFERKGIGLHTGEMVQVRVLPAPPGKGRYFVRVDLPDLPPIPAAIATLDRTLLSTELVHGDGRVRTVEHLLAALTGMGITNVRIEIDGPEVPLLDGSAQEWVWAIAQAGCQPQSVDSPVWTIAEPVMERDGSGAFVMAMPSAELRFTYGIDFELAAIGNQWHSWAPAASSFEVDIAPARTFGLLHQIEALQHSGLIQGGSLENALVCGPDGWLNPPLRYANEPVRHKLLDLVGDLSLLGTIPIAHYLAYKASHQLHTQLARQLSVLHPKLGPES